MKSNDKYSIILNMLPEAILIHGWNPDYYNKNVSQSQEKSAIWSHRSKLISLLGEKYQLRYCNLPGFCGTPEPAVPAFRVEDFADYLATWKKEQSPTSSIILGYSFGGAVALYHKFKYNDPTPIILVSPAILRKETTRSRFGGAAKKFVPKFLVNVLKDTYQKLASEYYRSGTPFLRSTYDQIVREDLSYLIREIDPGEICFIYGENDLDTPWQLVSEIIIKSKHKYFVIPQGGHNIGQTDPEKIVEAIERFTQTNINALH